VGIGDIFGIHRPKQAIFCIANSLCCKEITLNDGQDDIILHEKKGLALLITGRAAPKLPGQRNG
jgi:hypothetical protein